MRKHFAALIALCIWASPAFAGVALVAGQTASVSGSYGGNNTVITLPNNPTTGNLVVLCVTSPGSGTLTAADANSNSYTATTSTPFAGSSVQLGMFYLHNAPSNASKNVTITNGTITAGFQEAWIAEFSGAATTSAFERDGTASFGGPSATINTPSLTTTNNGDVLVSCASGYAAISSANSPWTAIATAVNNQWAEYYVQATAGAQAVNYTQASSTNWDAIAAAFKAGAGAPACRHTLSLMGVGC
jgi:hypothetical protein